jgi:hypothetical protein
MQPDKLEKWLARDRPRAARLRIMALVVASDAIQVHEWLLPELNAESNRAGAVLDVCSDYADTKGESVQFRLEMGDHEGKTITATHHRASPTDSDGDSPATDADLSTNRIIAQFMRHDEQRERLLVSAMDAVFKSCANIVGMQGKLLDQLSQSNAVLQQQLADARARGEIERDLTEEEKQEIVSKAAAWQKAAELGPVFLEALATKWMSNGKAA